MTDQAPIAATIRHDGWTPAQRTQFLDHLAHDGSVCAACGRVGMSREAAYRLRRRDALFARTWDVALVLARAASADVLANRAIDGVEEQIWYRGELVGTRRKYDSRLLLAHMARLDRIAETVGTEHGRDASTNCLPSWAANPCRRASTATRTGCRRTGTSTWTLRPTMRRTLSKRLARGAPPRGAG